MVHKLLSTILSVPTEFIIPVHLKVSSYTFQVIIGVLKSKFCLNSLSGQPLSCDSKIRVYILESIQRLWVTITFFLEVTLHLTTYVQFFLVLVWTVKTTV